MTVNTFWHNGFSSIKGLIGKEMGCKPNALTRLHPSHIYSSSLAAGDTNLLGIFLNKIFRR
jgi:hypothetical protein